jgi:Ca2+/Na+ antiporter
MKTTPQKSFFNSFYKILLSLTVGWTWGFIILKLTKLYFQDVEWKWSFVPLITYLLASLIYIILGYCYTRFMPVKITAQHTKDELKQQQLDKRRYYLKMKPTIIKDQLIKIGILLLAILIAALMVSCKKTNSIPSNTQQIGNQCNFNDSCFTNKTWIPVKTIHADLIFDATTYKFYQNGNQFGIWSKQNCTDVLISTQTSSFVYQISYVRNDTMIIINPIYGTLKYHL